MTPLMWSSTLRVMDQEVAETLGYDDHCWDSSAELREPAGSVVTEEVACRTIRHAAEVSIERAVTEKGRAEAGTRDTHRRWVPGRGL
jgi:hypothetical protein